MEYGVYMRNSTQMPVKTGNAVFTTAPYGEHMRQGLVRTCFRNEVRVSGSGYQVVEVMLRGRLGDEVILCEDVETIVYHHIMQAIDVAVRKRRDYLNTESQENAHAAELATASERLYMLGTDPNPGNAVTATEHGPEAICEQGT